MFIPYKERLVHEGQRVQVYRNLNKKGVTYSIRDVKTGLVLGHSGEVMLRNCSFYVSESGRERVIATKHKTIHAWVEGEFKIFKEEDLDVTLKVMRVKYNPYTNDSFVYEHDCCNLKIDKASTVYICNYGVFAY